MRITRRKRDLLAAVGCSIVLGVTGLVVPARAQSPAGVPPSVSRTGTVTLGSAFNQTPWEFYDEQQRPTGIDVDLCGAIVQRMGFKVDWVHLDFKGLIPALQAKRFDAICAGVFITPERSQVVRFVPYIKTSQAILVRRDSTRPVGSLADLCSLKVSVLQGSAQLKMIEVQNDACQKQGKGAIDIRAFDTQPIAVGALRNANVDAFVASDQLVSYYGQQYNDLKKTVAGINPVTLGVAFNPADAAFADLFAKALSDIKADGTYGRILKKWGIESAALDPL